MDLGGRLVSSYTYNYIDFLEIKSSNLKQKTLFLVNFEVLSKKIKDFIIKMKGIFVVKNEWGILQKIIPIPNFNLSTSMAEYSPLKIEWQSIKLKPLKSKLGKI